MKDANNSCKCIVVDAIKYNVKHADIETHIEHLFTQHLILS